MKRRSIKRVLILSGILILLIIALFIAIAPITNTTYSRDYNETAFQRITIGDSIEKVKAALGKPVYEVNRENEEIHMVYSEGGFLYYRRIIIAAKGKVIQKISDIDID